MKSWLRARAVAMCIAMTIAVAACGSTVPQSASDRLAQAGDGQGLDAPDTAASEGSSASGGSSSSGGVAGRITSGTTGRNSASSPRAQAGQAATIPTKGRGWDANNVYIGLTTVKDKGEAAAAIGVESNDPGDLEGQANAVAKYYNDRGGLFGRKVVVRIDDHKYAANAAQPDVEAQASCTKFTQDEPVIGVVSIDVNTDSYRECLSAAGIPLMIPSTPAYDDQLLREGKGLVFQLYTPSWNRFAPVFIDRLKAQGYFTGWDTAAGGPGPAPVRVGLVYADDPTSQRVHTLTAATLTKAGHRPAASFMFHDWAQDVASAVFQMRSNNVTHVIYLHFGAFAFATAAESQHYRPRYGISTAVVPTAGMKGAAPAAQLVGAVGLGTVPSLDIDNGSSQATPGGKLCRDILAADGQNYEGRSLAFGYATAHCDSIRLIVDSALAGGGLTGAAIVAGAAKVGSTFAPAATFASGLTTGSPVVPTAGLDLQYVQSCSCFKYVNQTLRRF